LRVVTKRSVIPAQAYAVLLAAGERLGWTFRDRNAYKSPFPEPPPIQEAVPPKVMLTAGAKKGKLAGRLTQVIFFGATLAGLVGVGAYVMGKQKGTAEARPFWAIFGLVIVVTAALAAMTVARHKAVVAKPERIREKNEVKYGQALAEWEGRRAAFDETEQERVDALPEWGTARHAPGIRRMDVVGGNLWSWEAFLTIYGGSMLATRGPLTVVDLTGEAVCRELVRMSATTKVPVDIQLLPTELGESDLLVGLDSRQLVDVLVESMYGDAEKASRGDRSMDDRIITSVLAAIEPNVTIARLSTAMRVLMGEPGETPELTHEERARIADELFSDEYRKQAHANLRRIESHLHPLRDLGARQKPRTQAPLTCVAMATDGRSVHSELLNDLIVQWLMRRISTNAKTTRTLVVAGADELARRHIERLSDICDRRDVRLVMLFRHLREASLQVIGAGPVAFMKLGNHEEATRAADFIGREHKFVLSQLTRTLGGSDTHTESTSINDSAGSSGGTNTSTSAEFPSLIGKNWSSGENKGWNVSRSWGATSSRAVGISWSDATTSQRVYEYGVEPRVLQNLPDYAMLLVESSTDGPTVKAIECNPDIITLPRVTMRPLADLEPPAQPQAAIGAVASDSDSWPSAPGSDSWPSAPGSESWPSAQVLGVQVPTQAPTASSIGAFEVPSYQPPAAPVPAMPPPPTHDAQPVPQQLPPGVQRRLRGVRPPRQR
jgi:hypothetical protein